MQAWFSRSRGCLGLGWDAKYFGEPTIAARRSSDTRTATMSFWMNSPISMPASNPAATRSTRLSRVVTSRTTSG